MAGDAIVSRPKPRLAVEDLIRLAFLAGFRGDDLARAVAIALAESGGRADAIGDTALQDRTWGPSMGLWQIRSKHAETGRGGLRDAMLNADPLRNAGAAFALYRARKGRFDDWSAFKNKAYERFMPQVQAALRGLAGPAGSLSGTGSPDAAIQASIGRDPQFLQRIGSRYTDPVEAFRTVPGAALAGPVPGEAPRPRPSAPAPASAPVPPGPFGQPTPAAGGGAPSPSGGMGGTTTIPGALPGMFGAAPASVAETLPPNASEAEIEAFVTRYYGFMAWALRNPELRAVIIQAAQQGWDSARLQGAIFNTQWWRTHNEAARAFEVLRNQDPMQAESQLSTLATSIRIWATRMGLDISQDRARQIGEHALSVGMTEAEVRQNLVGELKYDPAAATRGDIGAAFQTVKQKAAGYLVPLSDETAFEWAKKMNTGEAGEAGLTAYLADMAKSRFPQLAAQMDMGFSPAQILEPYQELLATELELNPMSIDFLNDPRFSQVLGVYDSKTGGQRMMTMSEALTFSRRLPEFRKTNRARAMSVGIADNLAQRMGLLGG